MQSPKAVRTLLLLIFAAEVLVKLKIILALEDFNVQIEFSDSWLFICVAMGVAGIFWGKNRDATPVFCLLLASMAAFMLGYDPEEFSHIMGDVLGTISRIFCYALWGLFGLSFVHFALIFPVRMKLIQRNGKLFLYIYSFYILLLGISELFFGTIGTYLVYGIICLSTGAGILSGLVILIRKYFLSLTSAEKNRLQVALIGCLAGALPALLSVSDVFLDQHYRLLDFGVYMLPLFPLGLAVAVLKENFSEIGRWFQRTLYFSLALAGSITAFFFFYWLIVLIDGGRSRLPYPPIFSALLAVIVIFPLLHFSRAFVATRFYPKEESDSVNQKDLQPFQPIEQNPYIVGNPVRDSSQFFGREADFQFIRTMLRSETHGCVIVLCGERRTGKTSILFQILNGRLGPDFLPVFIDLQGIVVQQDAGFLRELAAKIHDAINSSDQTETASLPHAAIDTYSDFNLFMDRLADGIGPRRMVLLIDEYELIETKVKDAKLSPEIFGYFESLLVRYPWLSYVFTGSNTLESNKAWSAMLAKSVYRKISFLARRDAQALICAPLQPKVLYPPGMVNKILRLTNGHPFFTQVFCQTLVEVLNDAQTNIVRRDSVDEALQRVLENPPPQLFYQWRMFSDIDKQVLSALAALIKKQDGYLSPEKVIKMLHSSSERILPETDAATIQIHMENLREKSILDRDQTRYRFVMDLMRLYIQSEHNIWKVLGEIDNQDAKI